MSILKYVFVLLIPISAQAELRNVDLQAIRFFPGGVDPLTTQNGLPNRTMGMGFGVNVDMDILKYGYWDNNIHATTDSYLLPDGSTKPGQFRTVGWQFRLGANLTKDVQLGYYHHSQHVLDSTSTLGPFPRVDGIELRWNIFSSKKERNTIF